MGSCFGKCWCSCCHFSCLPFHLPSSMSSRLTGSTQSTTKLFETPSSTVECSRTKSTRRSWRNLCQPTCLKVQSASLDHHHPRKVRRRNSNGSTASSNDLDFEIPEPSSNPRSIQLELLQPTSTSANAATHRATVGYSRYIEDSIEFRSQNRNHPSAHQVAPLDVSSLMTGTSNIVNLNYNFYVSPVASPKKGQTKYCCHPLSQDDPITHIHPTASYCQASLINALMTSPKKTLKGSLHPRPTPPKSPASVDLEWDDYDQTQIKDDDYDDDGEQERL